MFKAFDPDPDISDPSDPDWGTGTWHYADGGSAYGKGDPEEASNLYKPPAQPDERLAFNDADAAEWAGEGGQQMTPLPGQAAMNANQPQSDVGPPPMLARPEEPEQTGGVDIPKSSRIAYVHNNPGNLKYAGQEGAHKGEPAADGGFWAAFDTPDAGVAGLSRQVDLDASRGKTVKEFISKYAPPGSNDTAKYIADASAALGASPDAKLSDLDHGKVVAFMAQKESGTRLGGGIQSDVPTMAPTPGMPNQMNGMPAAMAEMHGAPKTPQQMATEQQGIALRAGQQVDAAQQAQAIRQQGRQEALALVQDHTERFKADQQAQLQQAVATKMEAQQNVQQAMAQQLDPGRVIKNMGTGGMVLGALAVVGATIGNALAMTKGMKTVSATDWISKAIDDDLENQKDDKKSRVAYWTGVFKDADMGAKAARAEMWNAAGQMAQTKAQSLTQNADAQAQLMQDSATMIANGQKEAQGLVDRENERLTIKYAPPVTKDAVDQVDQMAKKLAARKAYEDSGASPEQLAGFDSAMGIATPKGESVRQQKTREDGEAIARKNAELTETEGKAEAAHDTVNQLGQTSGLHRDPKTGQWAVPEGMNLGWKLGKRLELNAAREAAVEGLARLQTGAAISENEEKRFSKLLGNENASLEEIAINLNSLDSLLKSRRKQSRVGPEGNAAPSSWK